MTIRFSCRYPVLTVALVAVSLASMSCAGIAAPLVALPVSASAPPQGLTTALQKPHGSGIVVRYRVDGGTAMGQPATITLMFDGVTDAAAQVRFTADAGLLVPGVNVPVALPGGASQLSLQATPQADGLYYVNVFTRQGGATSVMSVPVHAGTAAPKLRSMGQSKPAVQGDRIIALPVP